jgi:hypothetical protein
LVLKKFVEDNPKRYRFIDCRLGGKPGPNFLAEDLENNRIFYAEVELDAKQTDKAKRIAARARRLVKRYKKPVLLAMVSSSEKWVTTRGRTGVKDFLEDLVQQGKVRVIRVSPLAIGAYASTFVGEHRPLEFTALARG